MRSSQCFTQLSQSRGGLRADSKWSDEDTSCTVERSIDASADSVPVNLYISASYSILAEVLSGPDVLPVVGAAALVVIVLCAFTRVHVLRTGPIVGVAGVSFV